MGNWTSQIAAVQAHVVDRFFPFDAQWYERIARDGYSWVPAQARLKQDVVFFPLWPLILRGLALVLHAQGSMPWGAVCNAWMCAAGAVLALQRSAPKAAKVFGAGLDST